MGRTQIKREIGGSKWRRSLELWLSSSRDFGEKVDSRARGFQRVLTSQQPGSQLFINVLLQGGSPFFRKQNACPGVEPLGGLLTAQAGEPGAAWRRSRDGSGRQ